MVLGVQAAVDFLTEQESCAEEREKAAKAKVLTKVAAFAKKNSDAEKRKDAQAAKKLGDVVQQGSITDMP